MGLWNAGAEESSWGGLGDIISQGIDSLSQAWMIDRQTAGKIEIEKIRASSPTSGLYTFLIVALVIFVILKKA